MMDEKRMPQPVTSATTLRPCDSPSPNSLLLPGLLHNGMPARLMPGCAMCLLANGSAHNFVNCFLLGMSYTRQAEAQVFRKSHSVVDQMIQQIVFLKLGLEARKKRSRRFNV